MIFLPKILSKTIKFKWCIFFLKESYWKLCYSSICHCIGIVVLFILSSGTAVCKHSCELFRRRALGISIFLTLSFRQYYRKAPWAHIQGFAAFNYINAHIPSRHTMATESWQTSRRFLVFSSRIKSVCRYVVISKLNKCIIILYSLS